MAHLRQQVTLTPVGEFWTRQEIDQIRLMKTSSNCEILIFVFLTILSNYDEGKSNTKIYFHIILLKLFDLSKFLDGFL